MTKRKNKTLKLGTKEKGTGKTRTRRKEDKKMMKRKTEGVDDIRWVDNMSGLCSSNFLKKIMEIQKRRLFFLLLDKQ